MNERRPIRLNEWKNSHSPADADLMGIAERELGAFIRAVTELFGPEQARLAAEEWVDELELVDALPGPTRRDLGIGHCRCLGPTCKAAEYRRGPSHATGCVD